MNAALLLSEESPSSSAMARIDLIPILFFLLLCLDSQARESPRLAGNLRVRSIAIEDSELSRQIALSLRNPLGRRFYRSHRMSNLPAIRLPGGFQTGPVPLRNYRLDPAIPVENFRQIIGDSRFVMHNSLEGRRMKIKGWEKGGGDVLPSTFWGFLKGAFKDFYGLFTGFVRRDYY